MENNTNEHKIIEAAKRTFLSKGYENTSMTDIAEAVELTRPAIHYYFRTKERLFNAVAGDILGSFVPEIRDILLAEITLEEKVRSVVELYFSIIQELPELPVFIFTEINRDISTLVKAGINDNIRRFANDVLEALQLQMEKGVIKQISILSLLQTFYGLMIIPFIARPVAILILGSDPISAEALSVWKEEVIRHMLFALKPETEI